MRKAVIPILLALSLAALPLSAQDNKKKSIDLDLYNIAMEISI